ncbi:MAG: sporulation protein YqfD [Clostridiaceae bacterium]|nr:sporulation protein YqfD [Clostridiaceae bacterium]
MLFRLWNYLRGYVIIIVEGYFIEKFINICAKRRIQLWDCRIQKQYLATMRMSVKGFRLIRPVARKTGCKVRLLKKTGLPFVFNKYRRRRAFFAGALLFLILINFLASFIWSVEISGNKELEQSVMEEALAENGIRTGVFKYRIDTDRAVTGMMLRLEKLAWISINIKGTKVKVDIRERKNMPEIVPRDIPCDIIARKDGIIRQVIAKEGIEAVAEGDTVKKGQILISGKIPLKGGDDGSRLAHAMGTVKARTWYEAQAPVILDKAERLRTGRYITDNSLVLFSREIDLFKKKNRFQDYSVSRNVKKLSIGEDLVLPVEWITIKYIEEKIVYAYVSKEDAKREAVAQAYDKALEQVPDEADVVERIDRFIEEDGSITASVTLECIEDIGMSKRIGGN